MSEDGDFAMRIQCSACGNPVQPGTLGPCGRCGGILCPCYAAADVGELKKIRPGPGIDRYRKLLPVSLAIPELGEGDTPLIRSRRIGPGLGLPQLYFKNEGRNPTGAFKDRAGALAAALAIEAGATGILSASSGNSAAAIAAYCAAAGLKCFILLEPGNPPGKLRQAVAAGAVVIPVRGLFDHGPETLAALLQEVARRLNCYPAFIYAPVNPYLLEGIKTISYEIAARLPGAPDALVCPVGGGDMFTAQWRGYLELQRAGVIEALPRMIAVQSVSAPPLLEAFRIGAERVTPVAGPSSRLSGINVPFTGNHALAAVRGSGGTVAGIEDDEALAMQARLAREEGIWVEPASAAPVAALHGLLERGEIRADDRVVCLLSGAGFKDSHLAESEAAAINQREPVAFSAAAIARLGHA
jgi:threonine synthase